jgi:hypothetical protein
LSLSALDSSQALLRKGHVRLKIGRCMISANDLSRIFFITGTMLGLYLLVSCDHPGKTAFRLGMRTFWLFRVASSSPRSVDNTVHCLDHRHFMLTWFFFGCKSSCSRHMCGLYSNFYTLPQVGIMYRLSEGCWGEPGSIWMAGCVGPPAWKEAADVSLHLFPSILCLTSSYCPLPPKDSLHGERK